MTTREQLAAEIAADEKRKPFAVHITPQSSRGEIGAQYTAARFATWADARDFCRHKISYTGERVRRVEVQERGNGPRAMWDLTWDSVSKHAGLWRE